MAAFQSVALAMIIASLTHWLGFGPASFVTTVIGWPLIAAIYGRFHDYRWARAYRRSKLTSART